MLDAIDHHILSLLQANARINNADIARQVGMAPSAVHERLRKLERRQLIQVYLARLDPTALGLGLLAYIFVKSNEAMADMCTGTELAKIPEVQEVHHVAGEDCYLIKVRTENPDALGRLLRDKLGAIPSVIATRSTIVLETIKEDPRMPMPTLDGAEGTDA